MNTTARAAYLILLEIAGAGREFRVDQVLTKFEGDPARVIGRGYDFQEKVPIIGQTGEETFDGTVDVRLLHMPPSEVLVRVRARWTSSFGDHSSYAACVLTPPAAEWLDGVGAANADTADTVLRLLHLPRQKRDQLDVWLRTIIALATNYQGKWVQEYPRMLDEAMHDMVAEYHRRAVEQARADNPDMLVLLSPTYLDVGRLSPVDLTVMCGWFHEARSKQDTQSEEDPAA